MLPSRRVGQAAVDLKERVHRSDAVQRPDVTPSPAGTPPHLFRSEVLVERQAQWLGTVLLAPRLWDRLFSFTALHAAAAILALLFLGEFTRKAKVGGWLVPQEGLVRVFAPQPGVVTGLHVKEGAEGRKREGRRAPPAGRPRAAR